MPVDYVNYVKHSKASVEESCDVEFFCCMITRLPTPPLLRRLLWLNVATNYYFIHHRRTIFGRRAFTVAGPTAWNSLPDYLRDPSLSEDTFRRLLMTYLFALY